MLELPCIHCWSHKLRFSNVGKYPARQPRARHCTLMLHANRILKLILRCTSFETPRRKHGGARFILQKAQALRRRVHNNLDSAIISELLLTLQPTIDQWEHCA